MIVYVITYKRPESKAPANILTYLGKPKIFEDEVAARHLAADRQLLYPAFVYDVVPTEVL